jgi:hypothetical protein
VDYQLLIADDGPPDFTFMRITSNPLLGRQTAAIRHKESFKNNLSMSVHGVMRILAHSIQFYTRVRRLNLAPELRRIVYEDYARVIMADR